MADIHTRIDGQIGRITLTRPKALNALSYDMCLAVEQALDTWRDRSGCRVKMVHASMPRATSAFCAGGDIAEPCMPGGHPGRI